MTDMTLEALMWQTRMDVLDHLDLSLSIPVVDGLQAQGDLIVIPLAMIEPMITIHPGPAGLGGWAEVPPDGIELLRGESGANPHTLVADRGTCRWTRNVRDADGLAIGVFENTAVAYLLHPEHGASGVTPGRHVVRRQREREGRRARLVAD
ncbi:hypothetical protein [Spirillospora sp. NPDC029432]|uniref:hypothetical protein n=1 Tax=Spirillospora sp. NPDC029432 TaxID=3154599 RepID=UPI0034572C25